MEDNTSVKSNIQSYAEFRALVFDKKKISNRRKTKDETHEILTVQFFMGHPLCIYRLNSIFSHCFIIYDYKSMYCI